MVTHTHTHHREHDEVIVVDDDVEEGARDLMELPTRLDQLRAHFISAHITCVTWFVPQGKS